MTDEQWRTGSVRAIGMRLNGMAMEEVDERGDHITDDILLLLVNGHDEELCFKLPGPATSPRWQVLLDTNMAEVEADRSAAPGEVFELHPRTLVLLRQPKEDL
jgi:glycogen operon protein